MRSGYVGLIGPTNAGKSTLVNALIEEKVAIVSPKPQTTRHQIKGIYTDAEAQLIFCDTPGLHEHEGLLNRDMMDIASETAANIDVLCLVFDGSNPQWQWMGWASSRKGPTVIVFNKADLLSADAQAAIVAEVRRGGIHHPCIWVSAKTGEGCLQLREGLKALMPEGPCYYPEDESTDRNCRFLAAEAVREQCFLLLGEEIPYGIGVVIDSFEENETIYRIAASIIVNRDSHKGMVIGKNGAMIKKIGEAARKDLERQWGVRIFLQLFVRVEKQWIKNPRKIKEFVYSDES